MGRFVNLNAGNAELTPGAQGQLNPGAVPQGTGQETGNAELTPGAQGNTPSNSPIGENLATTGMPVVAPANNAQVQVARQQMNIPAPAEHVPDGVTAQQYQRAQDAAGEWKQHNDEVKNYGEDWRKGFAQTIGDSKLGIAEAMASYDHYRKDNPNAPELDWKDLYLLMRMDPNKSVKENKEDEAKTKEDEKWEKISNVLSHFANLYNTAVQGAPAMQVEQMPELTKRQRERLNNQRALRDADWKPLLAMWQQEQKHKAAQAKLEHDKQKQNALNEYRRQQLDIRAQEAANKKDAGSLKAVMEEAKLEHLKAKTEAEKQMWAMRIKQYEAQIKYINEKYRGGPSGGRGSQKYDSEVERTEGYNEDGEKVVKTVTKHTPSQPKKTLKPKTRTVSQKVKDQRPKIGRQGK